MTPAELGLTAGIVGAFASWVYILAILGRDWKLKKIPDEERTRPNRVTWFIWTILGFVLAFSYQESGATDTQWAAWVLAVDYAVTFVLSLWFGQRGWTSRDITCLVGAAASCGIWWHFNSPEIALLAALTVDFWGAIPTIEKAWKEPHGESRLAWTLFMLGCILNVLALGEDWRNVTFIVAIYPVYMVLVNGVTTVFLWWPKRPIYSATAR